MPLLNENIKYYQKFKTEGEDYRRRYHELLAKDNNLTHHPLYYKLYSYPVIKDSYYLLYVLNQKECKKVGYGQSPFDYWINLLLGKEFYPDSIKDIMVVEKELSLKEAIRWQKALNKNQATLDRKLKIVRALKIENLSDIRSHLFTCPVHR